MPSLPFEHLHKNTAIDGPQPWFDGEVPSKDHCFDKCVKNFTDCVHVQYKEVTASTWLCKLYGVISDLSDYLVSTDGEMLAKAIHKNLGCREWREMGYTEDGVYYIFHNRRKARAKCVMHTQKPWTIIHKRSDGSTNFNNLWEDYKKGFGDPNGEYWLGNEMIHQLTKDREVFIMFKLWAFDEYKEIRFKGFSIEDEANKYRLRTGERNFGSPALTNDWLDLNGTYFTTPDKDHDTWAGGNCALNNKSAWWFKNCGPIDLNNVYSHTATIDHKKGIYWKGFRNTTESMKKVIIYKRPV